MDRRRFLRLVTASCSLAALPKLAWSRQKERSTTVSFYAAGARFYKLEEELEVGTNLRIVEDRFMGEKCYPIYALNGPEIGYVPKVLVPTLSQWKIYRAYLSSVDIYAVPWKRYEVRVVAWTLGKL